MAYNKVVYDGKTLIDLTADTVTAEGLKSGLKAHDASGVIITGTNTFDSDTSDATAKAAEMLSGSTAYVNGNKVTGTMPNQSNTSISISNWNGTDQTISDYSDPEYSAYVTIPLGYYDGSSQAKLEPAFIGSLAASNIRQGATILGVTGTMTGEEDLNIGTSSATPKSSAQTITAASLGFDYLSQYTVAAIPYSETANSAGGTTVTIG